MARQLLGHVPSTGAEVTVSLCVTRSVQPFCDEFSHVGTGFEPIAFTVTQKQKASHLSAPLLLATLCNDVNACVQ